MNNASAYVLGESATRLWGLGARERIARQLREIGGIDLVDDPAALSPDRPALLLRADYLFETRTLAALLRHSNTLLKPSGSDQVAAAIEQGVGKFGGLDIVVNNASALGLTGLLDTTVKMYDRMMDVNLRSVFRLTRDAIPHLEKTRGSIVNVSSTAGQRGEAER